jgi:small subunit ribosomal protein S33
MSSGMSYATRMARIRARIFGGIVRKTSREDYKVVHMFSQRPWQRDLPLWYPPVTQYNTILLRLRQLGLFTDEHLDFNETMDASRKTRGKITPKKGQGKRSKKKK